MSPRRARIALALAAAVLTATVGVVAPVMPARAEVNVDISVFHDSLSPYGTWVDDPVYGQVWRPAGTGPGWRPYTQGHWVYTDDYGWTWVSDEPWGWAPYHYGRWMFEPGVGWVWVPGSVWAPAWVVWRFGGGFIGWSPLAPDATPGYAPVAVDPAGWCFVPTRSFEDPRVATVIVPPARNTVLISNTVNVTNYQVVNQRIVNRSISVTTIQAATHRPVTRYRTSIADAPRQGGAHPIEGRRLTVYQPTPLRHRSAPALPPAMQAQAVRPPQPTQRPAEPRREAPRVTTPHVAPAQRPVVPYQAPRATVPAPHATVPAPQTERRQVPVERHYAPAAPRQPTYVVPRRPPEVRPQQIQPQVVRPPAVRAPQPPAPARVLRPAPVQAPRPAPAQVPACRPGEAGCGGQPGRGR